MTPAPWSARRALLADDNPVSREITALLLEAMGWQVEHAVNGEQALARVAGESFTVILMDCEMPVLDGYEAARRLRTAERGQGIRTGIPIIALTGNSLAGDRERCIAAGMTDYITKPVTQSALAAALARAKDRATRAPEVIVDRVAPTSAVEPGRVAFDPAVVLALPMVADGSDPEFAPALLGMFAKNARKLLAEFESAADRGDRDATVRAVHTLKSSSAMIGALALADCARSLEATLRQGGAWCSEWPQQLRQEFAAYEAAVGPWLAAGGN